MVYNALIGEDNMNANGSYQTRLLGVMRSLKKENEKKICEFIDKNKKDIIHMSINEAAEACQVSCAALVRFAQKLGYKGYQEMKISIAQEAIDPALQIYSRLDRTDKFPVVIDKIIDSHVQSLKATAEILDRKEIEKAVNLIKECRQLLFFGVGGSGNIALDGQHKFIKIGYLALAFTDSNLQAMSASVLTEKDVVIAISHSGASTSVMAALELAKKAGAKTVAITNYGRSPITEIADVILNTSSSETAFNSDALSSRIAELAIIDMLYVGVAFNNYDQSYENIVKTRSALGYSKI